LQKQTDKLIRQEPFAMLLGKDTKS